MNIVLLGIQGSGKGTVKENISNKIDFEYISTGLLLREEIASNSKLGLQVKDKINKGELVDTRIIMELIFKRLRNNKKPNVVFDGFPRNLAQAKELEKLCELDLIIFLNLKKEDAINRILNRLNCPKCGLTTNVNDVKNGICPVCGAKLVRRSDDTEEAINKRFEQYFSETYPLIDYYKQQNLLVEIDASLPPEKVAEQVMRAINEHNN